MSLEDYNKIQLTLGQVHGEANALARKAAQIAQFLDDRIIEILPTGSVVPGVTEQQVSVQTTQSSGQNSMSVDPTTTAIQAGPQ